MKHFIFLAAVSLLAAGCAKAPVTGTPSTPANPPTTGIANPASVNCVDKGGRLEIREDTSTPAGGQIGYCIFSDGHECEEWALFRGECSATSTEALDESGAQAKVRSEGGYQIEKAMTQRCQKDTDCKTPGNYLMMNRCPFTSLCLQQKCTVVCPKGF